MVYKRPTDFIPRKPNRQLSAPKGLNSDDEHEGCSSDDGELSVQDLLGNLPLESEMSSPKLPSCSGGGVTTGGAAASDGRWSSSSSLEFWNGSDDEYVSPRKGRKKRKEKVSFSSCMEVKVFSLCDDNQDDDDNDDDNNQKEEVLLVDNPNPNNHDDDDCDADTEREDEDQDHEAASCPAEKKKKKKDETEEDKKSNTKKTQDS